MAAPGTALLAPAHALFSADTRPPCWRPTARWPRPRRVQPRGRTRNGQVGGGEPDLASCALANSDREHGYVVIVRWWLDHGTRGPHHVRGTERHDAGHIAALPCMPCSVLIGPLVDRVPRPPAHDGGAGNAPTVSIGSDGASTQQHASHEALAGSGGRPQVLALALVGQPGDDEFRRSHPAYLNMVGLSRSVGGFSGFDRPACNRYRSGVRCPSALNAES